MNLASSLDRSCGIPYGFVYEAIVGGLFLRGSPFSVSQPFVISSFFEVQAAPKKSSSKKQSNSFQD